MINSEKLFKDILSELSEIIYLERLVILGTPCFKRGGMVVAENPGAHFSLPLDIISLITSSHGKDNWIACENN